MKLASRDWLNQPSVQQLLNAFSTHEQELRFVGGCVRDAILGGETKDIDAATPALPQEVMALLEASNIKAIPTGIDHGTVTAVIDGQPFEITTLRKDVACDGRHADVAYTNDWQEDASRRDFTMNALYCDADGMITDFYDGAQAAKEGRIEFIGNASERIKEDALRILRFFRFHATHGQGTPNTEVIKACKAHKAMLEQLSGERIQHEMMKLLAANDPVPALIAMQSATILREVVPAKRIRTTTLSNLSELEHSLATHPIMRLAVLLRAETSVYLIGCMLPFADVRSFMQKRYSSFTQTIAGRWKLSNDHKQSLHVLTTHPAIGLLNEFTIKRLLLRMNREQLQLLLLRDYAEDRFSHDDLNDAMTLAQTLDAPAFPISGGDLIKRGVPQGEEIGRILAVLQDDWEHDRFEGDKDYWLNYFDEINARPARLRPW